MNSDNRAAAESASWDPERVYEITGHPPHAMFSLNKIMWLKKHEPELYERTACFASAAGYLLSRLGFPCLTDYSLASRVMALDIKTRKWSDEILDTAGVAREKLPEPVQAGFTAGRLSAEMAGMLNLKPGVFVVAGGHDQPCGALGAGVTSDGNVYDSAGTYECLSVTSANPMNTPAAYKYALNSYCHVLPGKYITLAFFPAGFGTNWFIENFFENRTAESADGIFGTLESGVNALGNDPTGICVTPHFIGACNPNWDVNATGVIAGLKPPHTRYHLYRAIYEGIACELDLNLRVLETAAGSLPEVRISGGNAKTKFSIRLRADITGKRFLYQDDEEAVCRGAAMLAGIAAGVYANAEEAARAMARPFTIIEPDVKITSAYSAQKKQYGMLYPALRGFFSPV